MTGSGKKKTITAHYIIFYVLIYVLDRCADLFSSVFGRQFNDENLYLLETMIEDHGLDWVLAKQIQIAEEEGSGSGGRRGSNRSSSSFLPLPLSPELLSSSEIHRKKSLK